MPAVMIIIGKANWWLPGPLERHMPNIGIEGDEYFAVLDGRRPAEPAPAGREE